MAYSQRMGVGEKKRGEDGNGVKVKTKQPQQKNNLMNYFGVKT